MKNLKTILFSLVATSTSYIVYAQKTPSVQTNSVYAPANMKIDGRATEWDNKFQAYNNHVEFFYTLSNDNDNLYLTVKAVDRAIVSRIINGGMTLAVSKTGKKNDKEVAGIIFPLFDKDNRFLPRYNSTTGSSITAPVGLNGNAGNNGGGNVRVVIVQGGPIKGGVNGALTPAQADSIMKVNNTNFAAKAKNIGTIGIKDLDSLISVYNENGIKAAGSFDSKTAFTCEMAIPLKYLGIDAKSNPRFSYHILINQTEQKGIDIKYSDTDPSQIVSINVNKGAGAQMGQDATDFWGEYTLAKK